MGQNCQTTAPLFIGNVMNTELIKLNQNDFDGQIKQTVNARELWQKLEINSKFADWFKNRVNKYEFVENIDFISVSKILENGGKSIEYFISIDMAKELCMVENNLQGRTIRKYFIECEKKLKEVSVPKIDSNFLLRISQQMAELEKKIEEDKPKVEFYDTVAETDDMIDMAEASKILKLPFGRNKLFGLLRTMNILNKKNIPYQLYINNGIFKVVETTYKNNNETKIYIKTLITQKGLKYLERLLKNFKKVVDN